MKDLIEEINSTFMTRTTDIAAQRQIWDKLSAQFKPGINQYRTARPSTVIARETGDMGLSVLWIVQSMLIRPLLSDITLNAEITEKISSILSSIDNGTICALANSENNTEPVVYEEEEGNIIINGEKKFITAGANADLIIVTCRKKGEEKVSGTALIEKKNIPDDALIDLNLNIFKTVNHSRLSLVDFKSEKNILPEIDPQVLRKSLKKWGIIERSLIMESFISYLIYANRIFTSKDIILVQEGELIDLQNLQTDSANRQIEEALYSKMIETKNIDAAAIFKILQKFREKFNSSPGFFSEEEKNRFADLSLFDSLKG